jgi:hypothetical protein
VLRGRGGRQSSSWMPRTIVNEEPETR